MPCLQTSHLQTGCLQTVITVAYELKGLQSCWICKFGPEMVVACGVTLINQAEHQSKIAHINFLLCCEILYHLDFRQPETQTNVYGVMKILAWASKISEILA